MSVTISNAGVDPLPQTVTKQLVDKLYEKRKTAALDVEKCVLEDSIIQLCVFLIDNSILES